MSDYLGDFNTGATVRVPWSTNAAAGESITRGTNGSIRIYKDSSTTERTSSNGITDSEDYDTTTGVHLLAIDLSDNTDVGFYASGHDYHVMLVGAVIDSKTVNRWLGTFSIENRSALRPTVAGRTLDVSAAGEAGVDWANVGSPTSSQTLSGTTVGTATSVTNGVTVTTNNDKTGYALSAAAVQAIWDALTSALTTVGSIGKLLVDNINATISSRATPAQVNTEADTALADVGLTTTITGRIDAAVSSRATPAEVNAEVVDALNVDTYAEPTGAPPATTTLVRKLGQLYKHLRNEVTQTATTQTVKNDGGTADITATVSDDNTTFTRGKWS